ncbi:metallophosphoesterase family protein [Gorillibacterium timonense]|uniref:metallophosphoesterase family protein n=1 Tax=Gorillibacterium timonense TaxID=1689269 RepID=UPI00071C675D|nr:metallophosphoesterase [Gorillibacterium timonense]
MSVRTRIALVSDTHMPHRGKDLPKALFEGIAGVDLILHAGDWTAPYVVDLFASIAPVDGVTGNNDDAEIYSRFGRRKLLTVDGTRIGLVHGDGFARPTEETARRSFSKEDVDLIVFGHSHTPWKGELNGVLLFNPGSAMDKRREPRYSYGILEIGSSGFTVKHSYYSDKT